MCLIAQTAIGHWCEMMFPLYSILREQPSFAKPPAQFVLLHLKRAHLMEWVRAVIAVTLGVAPHAPLPPVIMQREQPEIMLQTGALAPKWPRSQSCL